MRRAFLVFAIVDSLVVGWAVYDEVVTRRPWKQVQARFNRELAKRGQPTLPIAIREVTNPALGLHDRCQTCHVAATRDGFGDDLPRELRTHPRRAELLGAHPPERYGCTPCHQGQGAQTKGIARAKFAHGRDDPYWERPLLDGKFVQASCLDCHETPPKGAEALARGRQLYEDLRCWGCHLAGRIDLPKGMPAPSLELVREKTSQAFVEAWVREPKALRADTRMPEFWPAAVEPATGQPAAAGSARHDRWTRERDAEPRAIAAYLASMRTARTLPAVPLDGDPNDTRLIEEGKRLFDTIGCRGCHRLSSTETASAGESGAGPGGGDANPGQSAGDIPLEARFGPALDAVGEKATTRWLAAFLKKPAAVWSDARMPDPRLTGGEITRLVAFLGSLRRPGRPAAKAEWSTPEPEAIAAGREAIVRLGCTGCHEIPGIPREGRPGPDLDTFGDKTPEEITFGDARVDCDGLSVLECWAVSKVRWPRRFEGRPVRVLAMPEYPIGPEDAQALGVFLLANRSRTVPEAYRRPLKPLERAIDSGERVIAQRNCRGCHEIGRERRRTPDGQETSVPTGAWIRRFYSEPALAPPPLTTAGRKFQYPWLWDFLRAPRTIRPFLAARMPDFGLSDEEIAAVAGSFAARDGEPYPSQRLESPVVAAADRTEAQALFEKLKCRQCHPPPGAAAPQIVAPGDKPPTRAELAPDLALSPTRLKPAWVRAWLEDPQILQPDTRMPTFFPPLDEDNPKVRMGLPGYFGASVERQIDALVGLVMERSRP